MTSVEDVDKIIEEVLSHSSGGSVAISQSLEDAETERIVLDVIEQEQRSYGSNVQPLDLDPYLTRLNCLQAWYLRASSATKLKCLNCVLNKLSNKAHLDAIVSSSNFLVDKLRNYTKSLSSTNYIFDKSLNDDNRSLEKHCRDETLKSDMLWFANLSDDRQMEILIKLLEVSSGAILNRFFEAAEKIQKKVLRRSRILEQVNYSFTDADRIDNIGVTIPEGENTPYTQEILKRAASLNEAFTSYRNHVMGITDKVKGQKHGKKSRKHSRSEKSSRSSKKSKDSQKTEKGGKGKGAKGKIEGVEIDQIQMLPIWIVKQIFSYLDQKTLKKVHAVNPYWAYVTDDLAKERACRKRMDKIIEKMETQINCARVQNADKERMKNPPRTTTLQKRMFALAERGAVHPKLRTATNKTRDASLVEKAALDFQKGLRTQGSDEGYESFPRSIPINKNLAAYPDYVLNELGKQPFKPRKPICDASCVTKKGSSIDEDVCKSRNKTSIQFS